MVDLVAVRDLVVETNFAVHGVDVTVSVEGKDSVETRGIWLTPFQEDVPSGSSFTRREPRLVMALQRLDVAEVPRGTVIEAPEKSGDAPVTWVVDGHDLREAHHNRVIVIRQACD